MDVETDALIQKTLRTTFGKCTILTIAHRLDTIVDSDKILSINSGVHMGTLGEFAPPWQLLGIAAEATDKETAVTAALQVKAGPDDIFKGLVDGDKANNPNPSPNPKWCLATRRRSGAYNIALTLTLTPTLRRSAGSCITSHSKSRMRPLQKSDSGCWTGCWRTIVNAASRSESMRCDLRCIPH